MRISVSISMIVISVAGVAMAASAATTTIVQAGQAFSETDISVKAGDTVKFQNQDDVNHNILVQQGDDDDNARDMGVQPPGGAVDVLFDKAGKFKIRCHIHPSMKLKVDVQ
jgi:plastocyanin